MPKRKPDIDDAEQEELDAIQREALSYGYHLAGTLPEQRRELERIRKERQGLPLCFRRSYSDTAPECRVCDAASRCSHDKPVPAYVPPTELDPRPCPNCEVGQLSIEVLNEVTGEVVDYGCTTDGCTYTLVSGHYRPASEAELKKVAENARKRGNDPAQAIIDRIKRGTVPGGVEEPPKPKRGPGRPRKRRDPDA